MLILQRQLEQQRMQLEQQLQKQQLEQKRQLVQMQLQQLEQQQLELEQQELQLVFDHKQTKTGLTKRQRELSISWYFLNKVKEL